MKLFALMLFMLAARPAAASSDPLEAQLQPSGTVLSLVGENHGARVLLRSPSGQTTLLRALDGVHPISLLSADLKKDGKPEYLATFEEEGSGGFRRMLLVTEDGASVAWESRPTPGAEAKLAPGGASFKITGVLKGESTEGDLSTLSELTWRGSEPKLERRAIAQPKGPWQFLTGGLDAMDQSNWKEAVTLLTTAVDSKEGGAEPLGGVSRHELARALLADNQAARARSILVGLKKRFPDSSYSPEAQRTIDLLDSVYKANYAPVVQLVRAEEAVKAGRYAEAEKLCESILTLRGASTLSDRAHFAMAQAYKGLGKPKLAVKHFQTIVLYFPSSPLEQLASHEITNLEMPPKP